MREGAADLWVKVGHVLCELVKLVLIFDEVLFEFDERAVPQSALHDSCEDELPLFEIIAIGFDRVVVVFGGEAFADVLSVDHIFVVEGDDEGAALGGLEFDGLYGAYFDGALGELFEGAHDVGFMSLVVGGDVAEVVQEAVFDHQ